MIVSFKEHKLDGHLSKPVRGSELKVVIDEILIGAHVRKLRSAAHALAERITQSMNPSNIDAVVSAERSQGSDQKVIRSEEPKFDILVCEDNEFNQLVISNYLEITDYTFKIVANGKLGVSEWEASNPKLILMDVSMPEMSVHQATSCIRDIELEYGIPRTPIIGITAHAQIRDKEQCFQSGMDDVLTKPLLCNDVHKTVHHWMDSNDLKKIARSA